MPKILGKPTHNGDEESSVGSLSLWINQILGLVVCIICNSLVVVGIRRNSPNYLIPWLAVYIIGMLDVRVRPDSTGTSHGIWNLVYGLETFLLTRDDSGLQTRSLTMYESKTCRP